MSEPTDTVEMAGDAVIERVEATGVTVHHPGWHKQVAITTMIMALLAAIGGMMTAISSHEALVERTREIIELNYLEGDRLHVETLRTKHELLIALGETPDSAEIASIALYEERMQEEEANFAQEAALARTAGNVHVVFAVAVTLLSLGITLGGMAVIVETRWLWAAGIFIGVAGAVGIAIGVVSLLS